MNKIWMMSSVAAVAMVGAMIWEAQPARSQDWLATAQSEFATKARDALIQRRMSQTSQNQGAAQNPVVVAMANPGDQLTTIPTAPVSSPAATVAQTPADAPVVESTREPQVAVTTSAAVSPAQPTDLSVETPGRETAAGPAVAEPEIRDVAVLQPAEAAPVPVEATPLRVEQVTRRAARPGIAEAQPREMAPKVRHATKPATPARAGRRPASDMTVEAQSMRALRRHAPEIAAMIGHYM